jgi:hypothetical protein
MASRPTARYTSPARDDWEAQSALDTLMRAEQIEKDAKLMKRVRKLEQVSAHLSVWYQCTSADMLLTAIEHSGAPHMEADNPTTGTGGMLQSFCSSVN